MTEEMKQAAEAGKLEELKRLAEAAPEGPWFGPEYAPGTSYVFDADLGSLLHYESIESEQDVCLRYVAAANPATVLELIAENERLRAAHLELFELYAMRGKQVHQFKAENEGLRKDAERYRWLREQEAESGVAILPIGVWVRPAMLTCTPFDSAEMADSVIDAAMAKEPSHD